MKHPRKLLQEKAVNANLEAFPGLPVVEIAGDCRILIENHLCICEYSYEKIVVKMKYGFLNIIGRNLRISRMSAQQLVITGSIDVVTLQRGS